MARPVVRSATGAVGCRMGVVYTPISFGDDALRVEGHGYESLFLLSLCEVAVDVVEDVGRVPVWVAACEGLCSVFRCVAGVLEQIVGLVHAVTDGNSCWVGAGPGGRCGEKPVRFVVGVPRHCGARIGALQTWGHPCVGLWWAVESVWWLAMGSSTSHGVVRALGSQAQHMRCMLWELWGTFGRSWAVMWCFGMRHFAPWRMTVVSDGLASFGASSRVSGGTRLVTGGTGSCFEPVGV